MRQAQTNGILPGFRLDDAVVEKIVSHAEARIVVRPCEKRIRRERERAGPR